MTKSNKASLGSSNWETVSTGGFNPQWKPNKAGESIEFIPLSARVIPKGKKMDNEGAAIDCKLMGGSSDSFFNRDVKKGVANGETFSLALSYNLQGEDKLAIHTPGKGKVKGKVELSPLSKYLLSHGKCMRIVFDGQVKSGPRKVNTFTLQVEKGGAGGFGRKKVDPPDLTHVYKYDTIG